MSVDKELFVNRELSWLEFNQRVLDEAADASVPLMERLKFLAITASNLDEFFMVRIGSLQTAIRNNRPAVDACGLTAKQQLNAVVERVHRMVARMYDIYLSELEPALKELGMRRRSVTSLTPQQSDYLSQLFDEQMAAILTPIAVHDPDEFPLLSGRTINVAVQLAPADGEEGFRFAVVPFGQSDLRFISLPGEGDHEYVLGEDVVELLGQRFFSGEEVVSCAPFRVTRNADLSVREDDGTDLLSEMEDVLEERKDSFCVRLEVSHSVTTPTLSFLKQLLKVREEDIHVVPGPAGLKDMMEVASASVDSRYSYPAWEATSTGGFEPGVSVFETIRNGDQLLYHPYDSFEPVVRLIEEAAVDPDVLAIKQTLYRTSRRSPIVNALMLAAENGKNVTVMVELKARFDEARNIAWARQLELAGVQVIYGVRGLKTHAKACVVVRRETNGFRRYCHFGTGNYNESTAGLYTDVSYMTANADLGHDIIAWFNATTGYSQLQQFRQLHTAPVSLRDRLLALIEFETQQARSGLDAGISAKVNSLVDPDVIEALYTASRAGVKIRLNVRGICCLRPGVSGLSENISVTSVIDRFLEHARLFHFTHGGDNQVLLSSADLMPRNLDRRVELLVPILDDDCRRQVIRILELCHSDTAKGRRILEDGTFAAPKDPESGIRSQLEFQARATARHKAQEDARRTTFTPLGPQ